MHDENLEHSIAIIGISGRFPGANNPFTFWRNLCEKKESLTFFSDKLLTQAGISNKKICDPNYVKSRGIIEDIDLFDDSFFNFTAKEAQVTDPQHRIFLECVQQAFDDAGYNPSTYPGKVGVYAGTGISSYYENNLLPLKETHKSFSDYLLRIGNDKDFLTTRASYKLDLKGPSLNIQTACSTSLVSICLACNQLLAYECDMAIAGGVSIQVPQISGYEYKDGLIVSPDGHCRPFDANSKGTVMSSGAGVVLLKRLEDAIKDKDHIYAIVRGYGVNNDGFRKMSYTAPSPEGQADAIASAIAMSEFDPETIEYVEAHGTGTILGDPIEIEGLKQAFQTSKKQYCAIGSVKGNIGHTVEAAGIVGFIKTVLSLYYQKIPPSIYYEQPNPHISFEDTPFYVNTTLKEWKKSNHSRRAGVSSFGIGGTNAHVVLEEWLPPKKSRPSLANYPIVLGAKTLIALQNFAKILADFFEANPDLNLGDIAFTLYERSKIFDHKKTIVASTLEELIRKLKNFDLSGSSDEFEDIEEFFLNDHFQRISLPTYPFERKRHWIDPIPPAERPNQGKSQKQTSVRQKIEEAFKEFLGIESINSEDDFYDLGGDSLLAIEVAAKLSKELGTTLGMQILLANPTIEKLTSFIESKNNPIEELIELRPGNTSYPPLFLIHPIEGNLFCFRELINNISCPNPIWGLQCTSSQSNSIEELASYYLQQIQKQQPRGPYHFVGASFGGILAYEITLQLLKMGESIKLLAMLDSGLPSPAFTQLTSDKDRLAYFITFLTGHAISTEKLAINHLIEALGLGSIPDKEQKEIYRNVEHHLTLLSKYQPRPIQQPIFFFESTHQSHGHFDVEFGSKWSEITKEDVDIHKFNGEHLSMLKPPHLDSFVKILCKTIQEK